MTLSEMKKGLVCLVPNEGKGGVTCHEKSVCDCTVIKLIELVEEAKGLIESHSNVIEWQYGDPTTWLSKLSEFQGGK